ncbi:MAG TPA: hypothetical protein PLV62_10610, partial [Spirochaetota bacterium]|nr:hypothetical protein [Spirochaetota bacterium]
MNKKRLPIVFFLVLFIASGCKTVPKYEPPIEPIISPTEVNINFRFIAYDTGITNPDEDKRCYYKIFIDKIDAGRTTIGLESQKKYFEAKLSSNMHLIVVEKWVLDEREGEYKKVNNILQPKPNFFYFETKASS